MKAFIKKLLSVSLCTGMLLGGTKPCCSAAAQASGHEKPAGYLAVYVASHEHNMGVEYAQFPSGTYTDTCRTNVLYYGLSRDGKHFEGLNNDKPVYYPKGFHSLGSPSLFRKPDGGFRIYWEGGDGNCYVTETDDFTSFSDPQSIDYRKQPAAGSLPSYARTEEAAVFELTEQEYDRIENKYGTLRSVAVSGIDDLYITPGASAELPEQVTVEYSDGSAANMGVRWDTSGPDIDLSHMKEGT